MMHFQNIIKDIEYFIITSKTNGKEVEWTNTLTEAMVKKNDDEEKLKLKQVIETKQIKFLLHFTPISNLENILTFGLLPRIILDIPSIQKIIRPNFPDKKRIDGHREAFCTSISWPNYKMLSSKRNNMDGEWAIIKLNKKHLEEHECMFFRTNAAHFESRRNKNTTLEDMFHNENNIRDELDLESYFTTNPEAEVLSSSRIAPKWIESIYFNSHNNSVKMLVLKPKMKKLLENISVFYESKFFNPRKDYKYWQK
jgi:hypothetical protein